MAAAALHGFIENNNILQRPTEKISAYLNEHPRFFKTALLANHLFRAAAMATFIACLPVSLPVSASVCFAGSLFYRFTVETNCAYKFALPAFGGAVAYLIAKPAIIALISGAAFASIGAFGASLLAIAPLCLYTAYIVLTVSYDVDDKLGLIN